MSRKKPTLREENARLRARLSELREQWKALDKRNWEIVKELVELRCKTSWSASDSLGSDAIFDAMASRLVPVIGSALDDCRSEVGPHPIPLARVLLMYSAHECVKLGMDRDQFLIAAENRFFAVKEAIRRSEEAKASAEAQSALRLVPNQPGANA